MESADSDLFDTTDVERSASEFAVDPAALTERLADHQAAVEELPGVENLVYEWRKQYEDPLIERTAEVYYLRVRRPCGTSSGTHSASATRCSVLSSTYTAGPSRPRVTCRRRHRTVSRTWRSTARCRSRPDIAGGRLSGTVVPDRTAGRLG
ncbi:hypothetical protein [Halomicrobium sp. IBSBa]|uniref:hypothetical protein n=1 Tax=Halomicrobium sp. IBSBa TaxID=2778916 RepID=UPI001FC9FBC3|nr:hypothetical protein [Halomicrobium sp. IBSBa]